MIYRVVIESVIGDDDILSPEQAAARIVGEFCHVYPEWFAEVTPCDEDCNAIGDAVEVRLKRADVAKMYWEEE